MKEAKKRDYKAEYKKFQSSTKSKKYRAELNKYNRKKGTYGNGDGKDASHKGGKIVGFESQSKNRGRAEKSRLKQESLIYEIPASVFSAAAAVKLKNKAGREVSAATAAKSDYAKKDPATHKKAKSIFQRLKDKFSKKKDDKKPAPKKQSKSDSDFYKRQFAGESITINGKQYRSINEDLNPYKDFATGNKWEKEYDLNLGAFVEEYQKFTKFMKKHKVVPDKNKRAWAHAIRKKEGQGMFNGFIGQMDNIMDMIQDGEKFRKLDDKAGYVYESKVPVNEAKSKTMKTIGSIIGKKQAQKISGVLVDMQTALVIMKVWNALSSSNRNKFEKLPITKMANVAWKLVK